MNLLIIILMSNVSVWGWQQYLVNEDIFANITERLQVYFILDMRTVIRKRLDMEAELRAVVQQLDVLIQCCRYIEHIGLLY